MKLLRKRLTDPEENSLKPNRQSGQTGDLKEEVAAATKEEALKAPSGEAQVVLTEEVQAVSTRKAPEVLKTRAAIIREIVNSVKKRRKNTADNRFFSVYLCECSVNLCVTKK